MDDAERIYREYYPPVYSYLLKLCADPELAEELTQETLFRAIKESGSFKGKSSFNTWLCTIAKNLYFKEVKRRKRQTSETDADQLSVTCDISKEITDRETVKRIHGILKEMNEPYKEVFRMRVFGEMSFKEIGRAYQKTESWARVTYHRARLKIKEELK